MCRITGAVRVFGKTAPCRKQPAAARTAPNRNGSCLYRKIEYIHRMRNGKESFLLSPKQVYHRFDYLSRKECGAGKQRGGGWKGRSAGRRNSVEKARPSHEGLALDAAAVPAAVSAALPCGKAGGKRRRTREFSGSTLISARRRRTQSASSDDSRAARPE